MLESIGIEYLIDLSVSIYKDEAEKKAFYTFNSEMLRALNNSIAAAIGGSQFPRSWTELKDYKPETRSSEEIKNSILDGLHKLGETE